MRRLAKITTTLGAALLLSLTGCAPDPVATSPTGFQQPDTGDEWWDEAETESSPISYNTEVLVRGDQGTHYGDDPDSPASILADGTIDLRIRYWVSDVPRDVLGGYLSTSEDGTTKGPEMHCTRPAKSSTSPTFECTVQFKDKDYDSGIYYAVLVTEPQDAVASETDDLSMIAPIYTTSGS